MALVGDDGLAIVAPSDCALLVAIPLSKEEFVQDVAMASLTDPARVRGDYAYRMSSNAVDLDLNRAWDTEGREVAELCEELVHEARESGFAYVADSANREAFNEAFASGASVIQIVAHRRPAEIITRDILAPSCDEMLRNMTPGSDGAIIQLIDRLTSAAPASRTAIRRTLSDFIQGASNWDDARDLVDQTFARHIVPGSCLELRDGYHKDCEIASWVPTDWSGVFDLGVCHSVRLALALKGGHGDRLTITNEAAKEPARCLPEMREAILRLRVAPAYYPTLKAEIFRWYSQMLRRVG